MAPRLDAVQGVLVCEDEGVRRVAVGVPSSIPWRDPWRE